MCCGTNKWKVMKVVFIVGVIFVVNVVCDTDTMLGGKCWIIEGEEFEVL